MRRPGRCTWRARHRSSRPPRCARRSIDRRLSTRVFDHGKGCGFVEMLAAILQIIGALALIVGAVLALPVAWALVVIGGLVVAGGGGVGEGPPPPPGAGPPPPGRGGPPRAAPGRDHPQTGTGGRSMG